MKLSPLCLQSALLSLSVLISIHFVLSPQIEYVVFGEVPEDLSGTLVFSNHSLDRLQERIVQLQEENAKQQKLNKECRERRKLLTREKREMAKTISSECLCRREDRE